ncbi:MAG TPA: DUF488 family protein [Polyangiaceae bacterium]|nr:DUF488 family protein [Polyangiaceae bacterium]
MLRIVRLGSARAADEGLRIGTVRRPPRGVPKSALASRNWYDVWYPELAPTAELVKRALAARTDSEWAAFVKRFEREMAEPAPKRTLDLLAALSHSSNFSLGCYCEDEQRCHRSVLRKLLRARGAKLAPK